MGTMLKESTVFIIDDDEQARNSVCALASSMGCRAEAVASAEEFLQNYRPDNRGCLVADLRLPGMSGLELQEELARRKCTLPVIILTAYAQTPITARAIKSGAVTLLDKPYRDNELREAILAALKQDAEQRPRCEHLRELRSRLESLTPEQRRVLDLVVAGKPNKAIANALEIGLRTVESRRREILTVMQANSVAELVRMVVESEQATPDHS